MTRKEAIRQTIQNDVLRSLGFTQDEAEKLRRISMTLHRWHERECGLDNGCIERDGWFRIVGADGKVACDDGSAAEEYNAEMSIENAHFIIEAVNNHDRLTREVAELRGLLAEVQTAMHDYVEAANHVGLNEYDGIYLGHAQDVEAKCRKALAKVTP